MLEIYANMMDTSYSLLIMIPFFLVDMLNDKSQKLIDQFFLSSHFGLFWSTTINISTTQFGPALLRFHGKNFF